MPHSSSSSSASDGEESSGLELGRGVIGHVVPVGTVLPNEQPQIWFPRRRLGQTAFYQDQLTPGNQARRDARQDAVPEKPMKGFCRNDSGVPSVESVVLCLGGEPFDRGTRALAKPSSFEHRAGGLEGDDVVDTRGEAD